MLDERERVKEAERKKINRVISVVLTAIAAVGIIGFFSSSSNRHLLSAAISELRGEPAQQPAGAADPSQATANPTPSQQPGANGAANPPTGPLSTEDMHFAGELMRFIQPPAPQPPPAPAGAAKH